MTAPASRGAARLHRVARRSRPPDTGAARCRRKFLRYFPGGFHDPTYVEWERGYKWEAHQAWRAVLERRAFREQLLRGRAADIAAAAVRIEARTNLLFSFEKMAVRDALRSPAGARAFAAGLYDLLYGRGSEAARFERWCAVVARLPRRQTRVATWPVVTVFPFIAHPERHIFLKPRVTLLAAQRCGCDFAYASRPQWATYASLLALAARVRRDVRDLRPRDLIDIQSYLWVQGSDEYPGS